MIAVVTGVAVSIGAPAEAHSQGITLAARADSIFGRFAGPQVPGCAVDVRRGGELLLSRAWGLAEVEHGAAITPATIFEAGSVSKQFTAAAVLLLAERGVLSLDDTLQRWFPEMPVYAAPITVRNTR
jgi:CubicO group peptidase (beta-lactamase class C family)